MSEDSEFFNKNKPQMNADERRCGVDLCGSVGKGMLVKEEFETLGNSSGLTPLGFSVNDRNRIMNRDSVGVGFSTTESAMNLRYVDEHEKNNELVRTKTNSGGVSSYRVRCVRCYFFSYQNTEMLCNSPGLSTLHPFDEIHSIKKKSVSLIDGFSDNEGLEPLRNSSGLTLNFDSKPQMNADPKEE